MFSKKAAAIEPSVTLSIAAKAKELAKTEKVVNFSAGEPAFELFTEIKEAGIKAIEDNFTKYTPAAGIIELRRAIAEKFKRENNIDYEPEQIIVSNGGKHTLFNTFFCLCNPGDEIIVPSPYWVSYLEQIKLVDAVPVVVDTKDGKITADLIKEKITEKTKAIIINSPSNPTGAIVGSEELQKIADLAVEKSIYIISDEVYEHFIYDGEHVSIASLNDKIKELTITINAFSKTYSVTGLRVGYCGAPKELAKMMSQIQSHMTSNPNSVAQKMMLAALDIPIEQIKDIVKGFKKKRDYALQRLKEMGLECIKPEGAFYLFFKVGGDSVKFCEELLEREKVAAVPGAAFGAEGYIRICYALEDEVLKDGLGKLESFIRR